MIAAATAPALARARAGESQVLDFKAEFEDCTRGWCELVKDIVAMANTCGGLIVFGISDDGEPTQADVSNVRKIDPARITDKVACYSGVQFAGFKLRPYEQGGGEFPAIEIVPVKSLIVFNKPGTYPLPEDKQKQKTAFAQGTVYVRHGAKSEPANSDDIRQFVDRRIEEVAERWKQGIAQVVEAPLDHEIHVVPPGMRLVDDEDAKTVRLVDDAAAPAAQFLRPDETHPYRQKELIPEVAKRLGNAKRPTGHEIQCARRVYGTDDNPTFTYLGKFGSPQYSAAFADWIAKQYKADPGFFAAACRQAREIPRARPVNKPR